MVVFHHTTPGIKRCHEAADSVTQLWEDPVPGSVPTGHTLTHHLSSALFPIEPAAGDSDSVTVRHLHTPNSTWVQLGTPAWQQGVGQRRWLCQALTAKSGSAACSCHALVTNACGHRTALAWESLTLAWESPASLPSAIRKATMSQPTAKAERKAKCRHKM